MGKIEKLTKQQEAQVVEYRQSWLDRGRLTKEPINKESAERVLTKFYELIGKPKPMFFYCQSPWQMVMMPEVLKLLLKEGSQLDSQLYSQLDSQLYSQLDSQLSSQLSSQLRSQLDSQLDSQLRSHARENWGRSWSVQFWPHWLAFYDFPRKFLSPFKYDEKNSELLDNFIELYSNIHAFYATEAACFICERPTELNVNESGRLHCETGPALAYSDGWQLFSINGVRVPEWVINNITVELIEAEANAEVKRVAMERYGWGLYLKDSGCGLIDEYTDQLGHPIRLWKKELGEDFSEPLVMVELTNSTIEGLYDTDGNFTPDLKDGKPYHKSYMFCVPPHITKARQAHAWHCGIDADSIEFAQQT